MALIEYMNRVHFADNILEEAVWAELDRRREAPILILSDSAHFDAEIGQRLRAGLPRGLATVDFVVEGAYPTEAEARAIAERHRDAGAGAMLALGPGRVINLAKAARILCSHDAPLASFAESRGGAQRLTGQLPGLIAVPSLKGILAGFNGLFSILLESGEVIDIAGRDLVPNVTISDPTVALPEPAWVRASAGVSAVTHCVEALLSPSYNPPAHGIAMDGLARGLRTLRAPVTRGDLDGLRELMAACMNAAMVQQKGLGLIHAMTYALCAASGSNPDKGILRRVLLVPVLRICVEAAPRDGEALAQALGVGAVTEVPGELDRICRRLPLPDRLADLGLAPDALERAAASAARHRSIGNSPCQPAADEILAIYRSVF